MEEKHSLGLNFQKGWSGGDIQYNNSMDSELLHARDAFPKIASISLISNERFCGRTRLEDAQLSPIYLGEVILCVPRGTATPFGSGDQKKANGMAK